MKKRVLIIVSNPRLRKQLNNLIPWEKLSLECCGEGTNFVGLAERIISCGADIVISDITGAAFRDYYMQLNAVPEDTRYILIRSLHNHELFITMHEGMKVVSVFEPLDYIELVNELRNQSIMAWSEVSALISYAYVKDKLKTQFLNATLFNEIYLNTFGLEQINDMYDTSFNPGSLRSIVITVDAATVEESNLAALHLWEILRRRLNNYKESNEICFLPVNRFVITLLDYSKESSFQKLRLQLNKICYRVRELAPWALTLTVSKPVYSIYEAGKSIYLTMQLSKARLDYGINTVIEEETADFKNRWSEILTPEVRRELNRIIITYNIKAFREFYNRQLKAIHALAGYNACTYFAYVESLFEQLSNLVDAMPNSSIMNWEKSRVAFQSLLEGCNQISTFSNGIARFLDEEFRRIYSHSQEMDLRILKAKDYLAQHYMEKVTLNDVADKLELTPTYLSSLFKKNTGVGLNEYLIHLRIEESKVLLRSTNLLLEQVCNQVGYSDVKFFSRIFKKVTGVSPSGFRKSNT